mgnify:CR=1 FL=1
MTDRIEKLLARALDPVASAGEAENSAVHAIREARRRNLNVRDFAKALGYVEVDPPAADDPRDFTITFGKYRGMTVGEVWLEDPAYIIWAADNITRCNPVLLNAIKDVAKGVYDAQ